MQIQRYRLNRASGHIYRVMESPFRLEDVGESLDMIILHATPPVRGEPFPNMPEQDWIGLCFLNAELNWSFTLLNSGKSNALSSFLHYTTEREISSVLTKVTLWLLTDEVSPKCLRFGYSQEQHDAFKDRLEATLSQLREPSGINTSTPTDQDPLTAFLQGQLSAKDYVVSIPEVEL